MSVRRKAGAVAWAAVGSLLLSGCQFNGWYDVQLPGGAAADGHAYHVTVEFRDVLDLVPQSAVKVNNVTVGAVEKVELHGWHARVRLRIADDVKLPGNALAGLRQTSILGEKYVSLSAPPGRAAVGGSATATASRCPAAAATRRSRRCCPRCPHCSTAAEWPSSRRSPWS